MPKENPNPQLCSQESCLRRSQLSRQLLGSKINLRTTPRSLNAFPIRLGKAESFLTVPNEKDH